MNPIQNNSIFFIVVAVLAVSALADMHVASSAASAQTADSVGQPSQDGAHVKYKTGKDIDFEELLIQGRLKRPEITVVTGDSGNGTDGLLKLRENFVDRMSVDMGEEIK